MGLPTDGASAALASETVTSTYAISARIVLAILMAPVNHRCVKTACKAMSNLQRAGLSLAPSLIRQGYFTLASGYACTTALLAEANPPTALFAPAMKWQSVPCRPAMRRV